MSLLCPKILGIHFIFIPGVLSKILILQSTVYSTKHRNGAQPILQKSFRGVWGFFPIKLQAGARQSYRLLSFGSKRHCLPQTYLSQLSLNPA